MDPEGCIRRDWEQRHSEALAQQEKNLEATAQQKPLAAYIPPPEQTLQR